MISPSLIEIGRALIRMDTTNPGSTEEQAALYVADALDRAGIGSESLEPAPGRISIVSRTQGSDPTLAPLVLHAHLDTVPVHASDWMHDPFGAEIIDGELWGRGAVDMKVAAAMLLRLQLDCQAHHRPRRDLIVAYFADEEMGGPLGSRWIVENRPDLFEGAEEAVGEIGGFNINLPDGHKVFFLQTAERGMLWIRIVVRGRSGHAAFATGGNPLFDAAQLISAIGELGVNESVLSATTQLEVGLVSLLGQDEDGSARLGALQCDVSPLRQGRRTQFVPTVISAGEKLNVIPESVELFVDCRFLPGSRDLALAAIRDVAPEGAHVEVVAEAEGLESPTEGPMVDALSAAINRLHPDATVLPFVMPGGSDAQKLARIGIKGYGYTPLVLPAEYSYLRMFHAADERLPVSAIAGGFELLKEFVLPY